jgi:hypothetical protein
VIGIIILFIAVLVGIAMVKVESEQVEDRAITPELPSVEPAPAPVPPGTAETLPSAVAAGTVILDLRHGGFSIEPAPRGEALRIEAKYDRDSYELREVVETDEQGRWTYRVSFQRTASPLITTLKELFGGTSPVVQVLLPRDVPLDLDLDVNAAGGEVELGGLWLRSVDLAIEKGGLALEFSEPLKTPMERMTVNAQMAGGAVLSIGNASPRTLEIDCRMGGLAIDLRGRWQQDSDISISNSMAGTEVRLPRNVLIEGIPTDRVSFQPELEVRPPTLRFTVTSERGEIEFID